MYRLRRERGLKQAALSQPLGLTQASVSAMERRLSEDNATARSMRIIGDVLSIRWADWPGVLQGEMPRGVKGEAAAATILTRARSRHGASHPGLQEARVAALLTPLLAEATETLTGDDVLALYLLLRRFGVVD